MPLLSRRGRWLTHVERSQASTRQCLRAVRPGGSLYRCSLLDVHPAQQEVSAIVRTKLLHRDKY